MNSIDRKRYIWVIISALVQGLLLGIYAFIRSGPLVCMPLTIIFLVPFVFWLSQEHWGRRLLNLLLGLTVILAAFWIYRLWTLYSPDTNFEAVPLQRSDLVRISMAVFLLIPFFQCRIASWSWRFPYSEIFFQFCRNLFLLFQASIVIAVFWGLLITAGLLFDIVGLEKIPYFIFNPITAVPLSSLIIAISISVAIKHPGIDSLGRWLLSVLAWLLPFFAVLSVAFLACLPFSGLRKLWDTGQASTLMLLLQFGTLVLTNAAYLDGQRKPFASSWINRLCTLSLLVLPVYSVLSVYSLTLRITQYGLTPDRIQALFLAGITAIWGTGYAVSVLLRAFPKSIGRVNIACVVVLALTVTAMNTPLLDPYRLSALNQYDRLASGKVSPEEFDYLYMRYGLGRWGNNMLSRLDLPDSPAMSVTPGEYSRWVNYGIPPEYIRRKIVSNAGLSTEQQEYFIQHWPSGVRNENDIAFRFLSVRKGERNIIAFTENTAYIYSLKPELVGIIAGEFSPQSLDVQTVEPKFMDLSINGKIYHVSE